MSQTHTQSSFVARWWFAIVLFIGLVLLALLTTPSGHAFMGRALVATDYVYNVYLSLIYK
ncbi:hypothetical protein F8S13_17455 [Chloroflexia bacterium SDU3-3]|nr:hypothetical protein F8S13_17455 [Chloroflexia bacterium SDU3-3]